MMKVDAIVPSHNEGRTIGAVLSVLAESRLFKRIIVVDDGGDNSKKIVSGMMNKNKSIVLLSSGKRMGKGNSVKLGLKCVKSPVIFLCDADLIGLNKSHVIKILSPVINGQADMCVGLRDKKSKLAKILMESLLPLIAGERALLTSHLKAAIEDPLSGHYGLEVCINHYFRSKNLKVRKVFMKGVNDQIKPVKWDVKDGTFDWLREAADVMLTYSLLYAADPVTKKRIRRFIGQMYKRKNG